MKIFFKTTLFVALASALFFSRVAARSPMGVADPTVQTQDSISKEDRITRFLVMGCDRAANLTDSIFIVTLNETQAKASILQIPRDTYANYTERSYKKLNGAMQVLGESELKVRLGEALGVRLDYFVVLDLDCLCRVVDSIGGIDVEIPQDMSYRDPAQDLEIDLEQGMTHLDGKRAEQFVRYRSGYANADLGRLDAQKLFLRAFAQKCKTLTSLSFFKLTAAVLTDLSTDIGLPQALRVASVLLKCDTDELPMATLSGTPVQGKSGAWYYVINRAGALQMANDFLMPNGAISPDAFDPNGFFDCTGNPIFHQIYIAPDGGNP